MIQSPFELFSEFSFEFLCLSLGAFKFLFSHFQLVKIMNFHPFVLAITSSQKRRKKKELALEMMSSFFIFLMLIQYPGCVILYRMLRFFCASYHSMVTPAMIVMQLTDFVPNTSFQTYHQIGSNLTGIQE